MHLNTQKDFYQKVFHRVGRAFKGWLRLIERRQQRRLRLWGLAAESDGRTGEVRPKSMC